MSFRFSPPWSGSLDHPALSTWVMDVPCKKCNNTEVQGAYSEYSGTTYYFCRNCGTEYPDESDTENSHENSDENSEEQ